MPIAVSTDANPWTSPLLSLRITANLACTLLGLTPAEALAGITRTAARALGLAGTAGVVAGGAQPTWWFGTPGSRPSLVDWVGGRLASTVIVAGEVVAPVDPGQDGGDPATTSAATTAAAMRPRDRVIASRRL